MPIIEGTSDVTLRQETNPCSTLAMHAVTFNATTVITGSENMLIGILDNRSQDYIKSYHYAPTSVWVNASRPLDIRSLH